MNILRSEMLCSDAKPDKKLSEVLRELSSGGNERISLTNILPTLSVIMLVLSLSERDGLLLLGGFIASLASCAVVAAIFSVGATAMLSFL
jgi:hypothetical protein